MPWARIRGRELEVVLDLAVDVARDVALAGSETESH
jgi:hypothetical protein